VPAVLLPVAFVGLGVLAVLGLYSCAKDTLTNVPITIGDRDVDAMAQRDLAALLEGDYRRYYAAFGGYDILEQAYRPSFERAIDSAIGAPAARRCTLRRRGPIERSRGGLDAGANRLIFDATAGCGRRRLAIGVTYDGDNRRPEAYKLSHVVFHARDADFAAAALRVHAKPVRGEVHDVDRTVEFRLRSDRTSDSERHSERRQPLGVPSDSRFLDPGDRPDDRALIARMGSELGWSGCAPRRRLPDVTIDQDYGELRVAVTYDVRCKRHVERR
jgi:hypothetical protein